MILKIKNLGKNLPLSFSFRFEALRALRAFFLFFLRFFDRETAQKNYRARHGLRPVSLNTASASRIAYQLTASATLFVGSITSFDG